MMKTLTFFLIICCFCSSSAVLGCDIGWKSKVAEKRLERACELITTTAKSVQWRKKNQGRSLEEALRAMEELAAGDEETLRVLANTTRDIDSGEVTPEDVHVRCLDLDKRYLREEVREYVLDKERSKRALLAGR